MGQQAILCNQYGYGSRGVLPSLPGVVSRDTIELMQVQQRKIRQSRKGKDPGREATRYERKMLRYTCDIGDRLIRDLPNHLALHRQ